MKYRKKPVEVEAFQMTLERQQDNIDWPEWLHHAWNGETGVIGSVWKYEGFFPGEDKLIIQTIEGPLVICVDDWIIRGVNGELYPCKPDVFEKTYEPLDK